MVGGVLFEHGHRMIAEMIGLLTMVLAVWTWRTEPRSWMRKLGIAALLLVIFQGVLGGITVLNYLPWWVSTAHATMAQTFFSLVVLMAVFTNRDWVEGEPLSLPSERRPTILMLAALATGAVYLQLILGAAFRHSGMKLLPHLIMAGVVTLLVLWTGVRVLTAPGGVAQLRRPAMAMLMLLAVQLALGFGAYVTRVEWGRNAIQPSEVMVVTTVAHVATGALLLATCAVLTAQVWRHLGRPAHSPEVSKRAVTA
jgi:cytochrome c oxidase assembly protein subunit 15